MTETKPCKWCQKAIVRADEATEFNWARRLFCNSRCRKALDRQMECNGNHATQSARSRNTPITQEEATRFVGLVSAGVSDADAAKQLGRASPEILTRRAIMFGLMPPRRAEPGAELAPIATKPERIEPLKAGADETWRAMMPDLSWKEAQAMTAHMGRF
ncbi:hypothetical protein [Asaia krungthepensis]|uniref:Uncharacterized protein n=1 Tax=Asaia krungthepensis NRIC 0535 TaxID=1307925 RepID=A0ABQ0Q373_9PROT|nr:hypothetical protein [Asaia krungthepensis]GBQ89083.1 hypothetical protein AA0535_1707 [Asaia krungthepensis NRIC 0535]